MQVLRAIAAVIAFACFPMMAKAASVPLAQDGRSLYAIVRPANPSEAEQLACRELAAYLQRMSGAAFTIQDAESVPADATRIIVAKAAAGLLPAVMPALPQLQAEGYCLAIRGKQIYLLGADDRAVLYAVYAFLERGCCRWLAPDLAFYEGCHEFVPKAGELAVSLDEDIVNRPALAFRKLYVEEGHSHTAENLTAVIAWMPKLGYNTLVIPTDYQGRGRVKWDNWRARLTPELKRRGIIIEVGGHGYQNFLNSQMEDGRLFREHPEWFGMDENQKRTPAMNRVLCTSNPEAVAFLQRGVLAYLRTHPEIEIFDFWPPDGARWCECDKCKALGSPSQRHATLVAKMATAVRQELPKVRIECIAYASYLDPPPEVSFDKSVLVDFCTSNQSFERQIDDPASLENVRYAEALQGWLKAFPGDISIYSYYRKYIWNSLPTQLAHYLQGDLRFFRKIGVHGVSTYAEPGDWFTYELNHYMLGRLAWNPDADVDALMKEFCAARYGPAAATGEATLRMLEEVVRHACSLRSTSLKSPEQYGGFSARIDEHLQKLKQAAERKENRPAQAHLRRLGLMLEYAKRDTALQRERAVKGSREQRRTLVVELDTFLRANSDAGVFLIDRVSLPRLLQFYGIEARRR